MDFWIVSDFWPQNVKSKKGAGRPGTLDRNQPQLFLCFDCFLLSWHDSDCTKYSCHTVLEGNSWEAEPRNKVWERGKKLRKSWAKAEALTTVLRRDISYELGRLWQVVLKPSGCLARMQSSPTNDSNQFVFVPISLAICFNCSVLSVQ